MRHPAWLQHMVFKLEIKAAEEAVHGDRLAHRHQEMSRNQQTGQGLEEEKADSLLWRRCSEMLSPGCKGDLDLGKEARCPFLSEMVGGIHSHASAFP